VADGGKSHATKTVYREFLARWVKPTWGSLNIRAVRTIAVEHWLRQLMRVDGSPLAPSTKAKIRNVVSVLFNHCASSELNAAPFRLRWLLVWIAAALSRAVFATAVTTLRTSRSARLTGSKHKSPSDPDCEQL
jgi:hypothetical protein